MLKNLLSYGTDSIPSLMTHFCDKRKSSIYSDCQDFQLNRGEIAIIMADLIEGMPYFLVTGIQNCLLTFCHKSKNNIESYLSAIRRDDGESFNRKYDEWFNSKELKKEKEKLNFRNEFWNLIPKEMKINP